ncbi:eukaryotic translation initiation factor 4E [Hesseltinella vesiculosa]|uniref:Eukaryotic translation initiation factor 4E n=1 Tax=Hesseltinella vesiculosa TaxID=101127 RepID=A0A1X2GVX0_9FUNG|nr:eukaryotic translation initiation factor 4E [Hesseltinella vesiculosa]
MENDNEWHNITSQDKGSFPIPEGLDLDVTHPLQNAWTLWYDNPLQNNNNNQSWAENLKEIATVTTVEQFWTVNNNLTKVDQLDPNANYYFFKKGIRPEWEDPANAKGGKYSIQFPRARSGNTINLFWLNMLLAVIGEQFTKDEVCGTVIAIRRNYFRIALWTKTAERTAELESIGHTIRELLNLPMQLNMDFIPHESSGIQEKFSINAQ